MDEITRDTIVVDALGVSDGLFTLHAPGDWHDRIRELEPFLRFGPDYNRGAWEHLTDMSRIVKQGYTAAAYDQLLAAERCVARVHGRRGEVAAADADEVLIADYLRANGYRTIEDWARDSDYLLCDHADPDTHGDDGPCGWVDLEDNPVDIRAQLLAVLV